MKTAVYFIMLILSSLGGASCYNESVSSEDLELGSQIIDTFVCKGIEVKGNVGFILPIIYFLFFILLLFVAFLVGIAVFRVISS